MPIERRRIADPGLGLEYEVARLDSGLTAAVFPRPGFARRLAALSVRFGSVDLEFERAGGGAISVPDGAAHFLEHQVFEGPQGNALELFSARGAAVNAYTAFTRTVYFFIGTDNFEANLSDLLRFVLTPWLTEAGVAKEKKIIQQEIRMYEDLPPWRAYFGLLRCLFREHPVRLNPAGREASVAGVTREILLDCYRTFYQPANMTLFAAGDLEPAAVFDRAAATLAELGPFGAAAPRRRRVAEPEAIAGAGHRERRLISRPLLALGFKDRPLAAGADRLARTLATSLLLELLFGEGSSLYDELYRAGLVDESFSFAYYGEEDFAFTIISAETNEPERLTAAIRSGIDRLAAGGVRAADLERARRKALGRFARGFDRPEFISRAYLTAAAHGLDLFAWRRLLAAVTPEKVAARLAEHLDAARQAVAVVAPLAPGDAVAAGGQIG